MSTFDKPETECCEVWHRNRYLAEQGLTQEAACTCCALVPPVRLSSEVIHERAARQARLSNGGRPAATPPRHRPKQSTGRIEYPEPVNSDVAELVHHYLWDGYTPADVSERLCISRKWCERAAREPDPRPQHLRADRPPATEGGTTP